MNRLLVPVVVLLGLSLVVSPLVVYDWHDAPTYRFSASQEVQPDPHDETLAETSVSVTELSVDASCAVAMLCGGTRTVFLHRPDHGSDIDRLQGSEYVVLTTDGGEEVYYDVQLRRSYFETGRVGTIAGPPLELVAHLLVPLGVWLLLFGLAWYQGPGLLASLTRSPFVLTLLAWVASYALEVFTVTFGGQFYGPDVLPLDGVLVAAFGVVAGVITLVQRRDAVLDRLGFDPSTTSR